MTGQCPPPGLSLRLCAPPPWSVLAHRAMIEAGGTKLIVVDTETAHLQPYRGSTTEVAWLDLGRGIGGSFVPPHRLDGADRESLTISRYWDRIAAQRRDGEQVAAFHAMLAGGRRSVLVGSNPAFDAAHLNMLFAWHGLSASPWSHRLVDVAAASYWLSPAVAVDAPCGLADACTRMGITTVGHHDAWEDVVMTARLWHTLEARRAAA